MNQQEIFTKVKNHLLTQMEQSYDGKQCKYRDSNGRMCAVGCLLPDDLYSPEIEIGNIYMFPQKIRDFLGKHNIALLADLQLIHDCVKPRYWEDSLRQLATEYNLEF